MSVELRFGGLLEASVVEFYKDVSEWIYFCGKKEGCIQ